ncbi:MAG: histidine kinase [Alphaproteobacteria bacterium]|nr:histidine kinase [Alphaproteobacteria bacterium]
MTAMLKPVDYAHLGVQAAGDKAVMREVLALFVTHGEQVLAELEGAGDAKTWKMWTHTLKGSARGVGAFAVADAAADAERHSLDKSKLEPLRAAFTEARAFIGSHPL